MDVPLFRSNFPEFASETSYPTSQIEFWASVAEKLILECTWKDMLVTGINLYVAHELVIARQHMMSASTGGLPGQGGGIANSKTVGSVSVGYDSASNSEKDAGYYNLTNYGKQFYRLVKIFGAGCIQL